MWSKKKTAFAPQLGNSPSSVLLAIDCRAVLGQIDSVVTGEALIPAIASIKEALSAAMITK